MQPDPTTTPEGAPQGDSAADDGTQTEQPTQPPAAATPPANATPAAVDVPALQRAYTQSNQQLSAVRKELGLEKDADLIAAVRQLRATPATVDDSDPVSPEVAALRTQLETQAWDYQQRLYGDTATQAKRLVEAMRTSNDPAEMVALFYDAVKRVTEEPSTADNPEGGAADEGAGDDDQPDIELGAGDAPLAAARKPAAPAPGTRMADYIRTIVPGLGPPKPGG